MKESKFKYCEKCKCIVSINDYKCWQCGSRQLKIDNLQIKLAE